MLKVQQLNLNKIWSNHKPAICNRCGICCNYDFNTLKWSYM